MMRRIVRAETEEARESGSGQEPKDEKGKASHPNL
jgi:hypothetical protein